MDWKTMLGYVSGSVDEKLLLRNGYLVAENRVLRNQIQGRLRLTDAKRPGRDGLESVCVFGHDGPSFGTGRDRDQIYGAYFDTRVDGLGIEQVLTAPRSPWQNPLVERMIGSIRRECLDHVIVLDERHLRRILRKYVDYYHSCRTHLSLEKDAPEPRRVESPAMGKVRAIPKVGGLHHYYTRRAA